MYDRRDDRALSSSIYSEVVSATSLFFELAV